MIAKIVRHFRRRRIIRLECEIAGLSAALKRTEQLASQMKTPTEDRKAIELTHELWKLKREHQILSEES